MQKHSSLGLFACSIIALFTMLCLSQISFCQSRTASQSGSASNAYACREPTGKREEVCNNLRGPQPAQWTITMQTDINCNNPLRRNYAAEEKAELRYVEYEVYKRSMQAYTNRNNTKLNTLDTNVKAYMNNDFIGTFKPGSVLFVDANQKVDVIIASKRGKAIIYAEDVDGLDLAKLRKGSYDVYIFNKNKELLKWQRIKKS